MEIKEKLLQILSDVTGHEYKDIFHDGMLPDEKLKLLTSESMVAIMFITSVEDEFGIELEDDEVDLNFFDSLDEVARKVQKYL